MTSPQPGDASLTKSVLRTCAALTFFCVAPFIVGSVFAALHGPLPGWLWMLGMGWVVVALVSAARLSRNAIPYAMLDLPESTFSPCRAAAYCCYASMVAAIPLFLAGLVAFVFSAATDPTAPFNKQYTGSGLNPSPVYAFVFVIGLLGGGVCTFVLILKLPKLLALAIIDQLSAGMVTAGAIDQDAISRWAASKGDERHSQLREIHRSVSADRRRVVRQIAIIDYHAAAIPAPAIETRLMELPAPTLAPNHELDRGRDAT